MAQISTIGAGIYTSLAYAANPNGAMTDSQTEFEALTFTDVDNVREFPSFGTPANIVNVPAYGQAQSSQVQGQADAPTLEFTLNYVPSNHATLQGLAGNGTEYVFRLRLANSELPASLVADTQHSDFYVRGQVAAFSVSPNLTDSNQATLTLSTVGDYFGPFTTT